MRQGFPDQVRSGIVPRIMKNPIYTTNINKGERAI